MKTKGKVKTLDECPKCGKKMQVHGNPNNPYLKCPSCGNIVF
jgi:tRNA(Ile2) C34 agmatinyltransferase TiaS